MAEPQRAHYPEIYPVLVEGDCVREGCEHLMAGVECPTQGRKICGPCTGEILAADAYRGLVAPIVSWPCQYARGGERP